MPEKFEQTIGFIGGLILLFLIVLVLFWKRINEWVAANWLLSIIILLLIVGLIIAAMIRRRRKLLGLMKLFALVCALILISGCVSEVQYTEEEREEVKLPAPSYEGKVSLEKTLYERRSRRDFTNESLSLKDLSQILWAAQGLTAKWGGRTAPSAGALYPLELYVAVGNVENISPGVYHYNPQTHSVSKVLEGDKRKQLERAALGQPYVGEAALDLIFTAVYERTTRKYGERGKRYVFLEVGHAAQNVYLQCESLGLGTVVIVAFVDQQVKNILNIEEEPLYIMPIGHPR